jgi:hypothetical protein
MGCFIAVHLLPGGIVQYHIVLTPANREMRVNDSKANEEFQQRIEFVSTSLAWGGVRWWFACPLCSRRVGCLYLPPEEFYFGCRRCYELTYQSSNRTRRRSDFKKRMRAIDKKIEDLKKEMAKMRDD